MRNTSNENITYCTKKSYNFLTKTCYCMSAFQTKNIIMIRLKYSLNVMNNITIETVLTKYALLLILTDSAFLFTMISFIELCRRSRTANKVKGGCIRDYRAKRKSQVL